MKNRYKKQTDITSILNTSKKAIVSLAFLVSSCGSAVPVINSVNEPVEQVEREISSEESRGLDMECVSLYKHKDPTRFRTGASEECQHNIIIHYFNIAYTQLFETLDSLKDYNNRMDTKMKLYKAKRFVDNTNYKLKGMFGDAWLGSSGEPNIVPWIKVCKEDRVKLLSGIKKMSSLLEHDFSYFEQRINQPKSIVHRGYKIARMRLDTINKEIADYTCKE
tara:strand:+ start:250 stop:912 length:663 start_codon:yes stop_codon:yes gene_type:complete